MPDLPTCPQCGMDNTYPDGDNLVCADCGHEWPIAGGVDAAESGVVVKDSNGQVLVNGDTVVVIKDLKVKGSSVTLKRGTTIKHIRLNGSAGEIEANHEKVKGLVLKTEFLRKA